MKMKLTKREKQIVKLIAKGLISEEIAKELKISQRTVDAHRSNAMKKTGAKNSAHLVAMWYEYQVFSLPRYDAYGAGESVEYELEADGDLIKFEDLKNLTHE
jgi:DNA-binding CsgD family transcriptional regulator